MFWAIFEFLEQVIFIVMKSSHKLKLGVKPLKLFTPETEGKAPPPRFGHSMVHVAELNIIVISGGRNDVGANTSSQLGCYDDIHILHLEKLRWLQVTSSGIQRSPRFSHTAGSFGTRLVVFGGMNFESYIPSELEITELDQEIAAKMQNEHVEIRKKKRVILPGLPNQWVPNKSHDPENILVEEEPNKQKIRKPIITYLPIPSKEDLQGADYPRIDPTRESKEEGEPKGKHKRSASVPDKRPPFRL